MDVFLNVKRALLCGVSALTGLAAITIAAPASAQSGPPVVLPDLYVTATRLGSGITGASSTIITKEDIERAPQLTLADILTREAGIQTNSFYGGVNGVGTTIDMRGFGITGSSNTLVLVDGRRLNDWDLPGFDLSVIAKNSIERIEITRGNSGTVLYGDGAIGGVINIVTKTGVGQPFSGRVDAGFGSFRTKEGNASVMGSNGPWSAALTGNAFESDGYRSNNALHQKSGTGDIRYRTDQGSAFVNFGLDDQSLRLPGSRDFSKAFGINELDRPKGTKTPLNFADKQGSRLTLGVTRMWVPGVEMIIDGGVRRKEQQGSFIDIGAYADTTLTTTSLTPRFNIDLPFFGLPSKVIAGIDLYKTDYGTDRSQFKGFAPIHQYDASQKMTAAYWQHTLTVIPSTDVSLGGRVQKNNTVVTDIYDPTAPTPLAQFPQGLALDRDETNRAYHLGLEHRFAESFAIFGRMAQAFRVPNVDERIGNAPFSFPLPPPTFDLRTQRSHDFEIGAKVKIGNLAVQSSVYDMQLTNELHLNPVTGANVNLDPTRRKGSETTAVLDLTPGVRLKGSLTYIDATYREGVFAGNKVPLVARWAESAGLSWDIVGKQLVFDANVRHFSRRFVDGDEDNTRAVFFIPSYTLVDLRLGGEFKNLFWSFAVQNVFDRKYYDYALDTSSQFGDFHSFYPQPGRTIMARAGVTW